MQMRIRESSQAGEARREAVVQAASIGFGEERAGRVALVVSELTSNLLKHAGRGGELFISPLEQDGGSAVEILALDRGPGLADTTAALRDGYSTAGSSGTGLGAVSRLSDEFELYSKPGVGTIVLSRIWASRAPARGQTNVGGVCAAKEGERVSGDAFAVSEGGGQTRIILADGLGHGPEAHKAAATAVRVFRAEPGALTSVLEAIHRALRPTRGAAVAMAEIDGERRIVGYAGIGNISGAIVTREAMRSLVSHSGTAGHAMRRIQEFSYEIPPDALLVLHSDGLKSRWSIDPYPGLAQKDPAIVAATLYRDFQRGRDDATAVVAKLP